MRSPLLGILAGILIASTPAHAQVAGQTPASEKTIDLPSTYFNEIERSYGNGFEYNYQPLNDSLLTSAAHEQPTGWQQSGLIGVSKIISIKSKFFRKTRVQLLWDFLSSQQVPGTQPVKFRVGYNF